MKLLKRKLNLDSSTVLTEKLTSGPPSEDYAQVVEQCLMSLTTELRLSLEYYLEHLPGAEAIRVLYIGGGGSRFVHRLDFFEREVKVPTHKLEALSRVRIREGLDTALIQSNEDLLLMALGLCLR